MYTPAEITVNQSIIEGHAPSAGMARSAVAAGVSATKAAPAVASRILTRHPSSA
jgi:hypothetical protein